MPKRATQYRPHPAPTVRGRDAARGSRHERGYNARWSRFAKLFLKHNSVCVLCIEQGRLATPATCVDHIDGKGPLGERGYDETNLRPLCTRCHNSRSARDRHAKKPG